MRITKKDNQALLTKINELSSTQYRIESAYGGFILKDSDYRGISPVGYGTQKELYIFLRGMLRILENPL